MTTGQQIKAARIRAGMTQQELADKLGISFVGISQWENGKRNPKKETLDRIAKALRTSRKELEGEDWGGDWGEYDKTIDTAKIADEVQIAAMIEKRYGKDAVRLLAHSENFDPQEWERLSDLIENYAKLDHEDRLFCLGRIMQLVEGMLAKNKYSNS